MERETSFTSWWEEQIHPWASALSKGTAWCSLCVIDHAIPQSSWQNMFSFSLSLLRLATGSLQCMETRKEKNTWRNSHHGYTSVFIRNTRWVRKVNIIREHEWNEKEHEACEKHPGGPLKPIKFWFFFFLSLYLQYWFLNRHKGKCVIFFTLWCREGKHSWVNILMMNSPPEAHHHHRLKILY